MLSQGAVLMTISLVLASCTSSQTGRQYEELTSNEPLHPPSQESESNPSKNPIQIFDTMEPSEMPSNSPPVEKFFLLAKKDLSERLQIDLDKIDLVKTEQRLWPNTALGCPAPGKIYPPGRVPGYRIWLNAGGVEYIYHTDWLGKVIFCPIRNPDDPDSSSPMTPGPIEQIGVPRD